jgi:MoxR-like ATPase
MSTAPTGTPAYLSEAEAKQSAEVAGRLIGALDQVLFGQQALVRLVVTGLLARGHLLLEGLPGLGKTELVKGLAAAVGLDARRVQFTPDLLPGDITGSPIIDETGAARRFVFQRGPIFAHVVLADEINRASPKTQSAMLEAMQERRVTVMGKTHELPDPFFVLATQNPIELEGTYPLPEAQLDRFLFKLEVRRNPVEVLERIVSDRPMGAPPAVAAVLSPAEFRELIARARRVFLPPPVANYIARLVHASHPGESAAAEGVRFGASPRAAQALAAGARATALLDGRIHAGFEDVERLAIPVLGHRVLLDYAARLSGRTSADVVKRLLEEVSPQDKAVPKTLRDIKV